MIKASNNSGNDHFRESLERLRRNEQGAVQALMAEYGPFLRRSLRIRIKKASLQSIVDSVDICQSVFCSFVLRYTVGEYDISSEEDLRKLLFGMANHKFQMIQRREYASKRQRDRTQSLSATNDLICPASNAPALLLEQCDLLGEISKRLYPHELELFRYRRAGMTWEEIACRNRENAVLLRKQLSRAVQRVAIELGLEDEDRIQ